MSTSVAGSGGRTYQIQYYPAQARWTCTCPSWYYKNPAPWDDNPCKHITNHLADPTKENSNA